MFANALGQERDAPLLQRRSELVEIRSVAPEARRVSRVALDLAHEVLDFGRDLPTGAADEGADFVRIEQPPARTRYGALNSVYVALRNRSLSNF